MDRERTQLARKFTAICRGKLNQPQKLLDIYGISLCDVDDVALGENLPGGD